MNQEFPLLADPVVCLLASDWGRGSGETAGAGALWGEGGAPAGGADVEAGGPGDSFQNAAAVSLERSAEEGGCAAGSQGGSRGPLRVTEGE